MNIMLLTILAIFANTVIGATIWSSIDDSNKNLLRWYRECPLEIAWIAQPLVLNLWPVALFYFIRAWAKGIK
jgi:hypothetical protein